jgi:basic amino acid/polyamine antiporter, APA family
LRQSLGLPSLTFYGVGMILGAGIYSVIGAAAAEAKEMLWLSFVLSGAIVLLTALSYAELSTMFPEAGAEYIYLREAFPKYRSLAFITSSFVALSGCATAATVSIAFAGYLSHFVDIPAPLTALVVLFAVGSIAILGIQESSWVNIVFTLIEVGGLILLITVGIQQPRFTEALTPSFHPGIFPGAALVFFSYLGFENIANLAEEAKKPEINLPRAILLSVCLATLIYVLVGLSAVALLSPDKISKSSSPLAAALGVSSPKMASALGGIALFATANTALISLIATSRILMSIARKKDLPGVFAKTLSTRKTPWAATLLAVLISALLLPMGKVGEVASVSSFSSLLAFSSVNAALITLRLQKPSTSRPFRVPITLGRLPLLPVLSLLCLAFLLTQFQVATYFIGGSALIFLGIYYWVYSRF